MNFQEHMKNTVERVGGFLGGAIADADGIIVEEHAANPSIDLAMFVAEYGTLWKVADAAGKSCELGASSEISIVTEQKILVIRKITQGYFFLLVVDSELGFGKARFYARLAADDLVADLEQ